MRRAKPPQLVEKLLRGVRERMGAESASILMLDADGRYLVEYLTQGTPEAAGEHAPVAADSGPMGQVVSTGKPLLVDDLRAESHHGSISAERVRSLVAVPLKIEGKIFGAVSLVSSKPGCFAAAGVDHAQDIADLIAVVLDRARLYVAAEQAHHEVELLTQRLETIQSITDEALIHTSLEPLVNGVLVHIREALEADNAAILLPTPEGDILRLYTAYGPEAALADSVRVPIGRGVAGTIAATRQPMVLDDVSKAEVANPFLHEQVASLLGVPILVEQRLVGVLHVDSFTPRRFTHDDLRLLQLAADRIGLAIDRARIYESEQRARAAAELYARKQDEFLGVASHELRTPLTSMLANLQMASRLLSRIAGQRRGHEGKADMEGTHGAASADLATALERVFLLIQRTERSTARLVRLVSDLLDVSRIQGGKLELRLRDCDLITFVRDVVEEQRSTHPGRDIQTRLPEGEAVHVEADPDRLDQVLINYLTNALKYSAAQQPVEVRVTLEPHAEPDAQRTVRVEVQDWGPGVPPEELEHIWERFHRVEGIEVLSGSGIGLGVGLYISREIIERHGGTVGVSSEVGKGATFWFTLPVVEAPR